MVTYSLEKGVKFEDVEFEGQKVRFPVVYSDQSRVSATYTVSLSKAKSMLPSKRLEPIEVKPGVGMLSIIAFEYRSIEGLKPYNEFGIFIPVNYRKGDGSLGDPGSYCLHLPVTTERARWGGVAIYGFPKIVADIEFKHENDAATCVVWHDGNTVAELSVKRVEPKLVTRRSISYTYKDGSLLKTSVDAEGLVGTRQGKDGAKLKLGTHRIAEELMGLNLGAEAVEYQYIPQMYSLLNKPIERLPA
jgi:hypothetical protein